MADLHFLRPLWWLAWPVGLALIVLALRVQASGGAWRKVVDRSLQPFVLVESSAVAGRRGSFIVAALAWTLGVVALAGPAWEQLPVPAMRSNDALVVALDLSRSMDARDLSPSRLTRAKLKLLSLLEQRRGGQTGLVVFSGHAFTVTPLTTDTKTIGSLVAALSTDIMPSDGTRLDRGLEQAAQLLRHAEMTAGRIIVVTDAAADEDALRTAAQLRREGFEIGVLGVGTEEGAPIPEPNGGFVLDARGNVAVPRLEPDTLAELASRGGGSFTVMTADDRDLERLLPAADALTQRLEVVDDENAVVADAWKDAGLWVAVLLLPLLALGFRRGVLAVWLMAVLLLPTPVPAQPPAGTPVDAETGAAASAPERVSGAALGDLWASLWRRPDQRGLAAFDASRPARAAQLFTDPEWRAAAQYRAGAFEASAASLDDVDTAAAHYNRGNALARAGRIGEAIAAYERTLEHDPEHADALYNRDLLRELLESEPQSSADSGRQGEQGEQGGERDQGQDGAQTAANEAGESPGSEADDAGGDEAQADPSGESGDGEARQADAAEDADRDGEAAESSEPGRSSSGAADEGFADADMPENAQPGDNEAPDGTQPDDAAGENGELRADESPLEAVSPADAEALEEWASSQSADQWLRRVPQDPGGLLRRKFLYQYQRLGLDREGETGEQW